MNTNHLTFNRPILIDLTPYLSSFLSPRFMEGFCPSWPEPGFFVPRRTVSKSLGQADCGGNEWLGSEAHRSGVGTVDGSLAWKPVEGKVIPLYKSWHPRWLAGFCFHQQVWIVWTWKISHDSVSVGDLFEKDLIWKQHEWIACTPAHPGLADLPAVQVGGMGKHYKNLIMIPQESMVKMCAVVWNGLALHFWTAFGATTTSMTSDQYMIEDIMHHRLIYSIYALDACFHALTYEDWINWLMQNVMLSISEAQPASSSSISRFEQKKSLKFSPARLTPCLSDPVRPKTQQQMNRNKLRESIWKTNGRSKWEDCFGISRAYLWRSMKHGGHSVVVAIPIGGDM